MNLDELIPDDVLLLSVKGFFLRDEGELSAGYCKPIGGADIKAALRAEIDARIEMAIAKHTDDWIHQAWGRAATMDYP